MSNLSCFNEKVKVQNKKQQVFVGLSGGVDSSVSAALLKDQGFDVTGVFIKVWHPDFLPCNWKEERRDAMRVCARLDIPFLTFDFEQEYKKEVVDYMIDEYKRGRTPNPDVMCNKEVKFGLFLKKALEMGADFVATGHYAQRGEVKSKGQEVTYTLHESADKNKDQSYFLWTLNQKQLKYVLFPVGHLEKPQVRKLAEKYGLDTATKKDSQGLCFIGKVNMKDFLGNFIEGQKGDVLDHAGKIIGFHDGAVFYTMGQRHGFTITKKSPNDKPLYVISKDIKKNTITVSNKVDEKEYVFTARGLTLGQVNWVSEAPEVGKKYLARIRYRQEAQTCEFTKIGKITELVFDEVQNAVSLEQSVVVYDNEECLGGGVIERVA